MALGTPHGRAGQARVFRVMRLLRLFRLFNLIRMVWAKLNHEARPPARGADGRPSGLRSPLMF